MTGRGRRGEMGKPEEGQSKQPVGAPQGRPQGILLNHWSQHPRIGSRFQACPWYRLLHWNLLLSRRGVAWLRQGALSATENRGCLPRMLFVAKLIYTLSEIPHISCRCITP